jgi:hypothetical protein
MRTDPYWRLRHAADEGRRDSEDGDGGDKGHDANGSEGAPLVGKGVWESQAECEIRRGKR